MQRRKRMMQVADKALRCTIMPGLAIAFAFLMVPGVASAFPGDATVSAFSREVATSAKKKKKTKKQSPLDPKKLPKAVACNPAPAARCDGATLAGFSLAGKDLSGISLRFANLGKADLSGANLTGGQLFGANLEGANLNFANFAGADLSFARMKGATTEGTVFDGAAFDFAELPDGTSAGAWCVIYQSCR